MQKTKGSQWGQAVQVKQLTAEKCKLQGYGQGLAWEFSSHLVGLVKSFQVLPGRGACAWRSERWSNDFLENGFINNTGGDWKFINKIGKGSYD